jgi:hypothetical protein
MRDQTLARLRGKACSDARTLTALFTASLLDNPRTAWLLALLFYSGNSLAELINWSSAAFFGAVNLALPPLLYLAQERLALRGEVAGGGESEARLLGDDGGLAEDDALAAKSNDDDGAPSGGVFSVRSISGGGGGGGGGGASSSSRGLLIELPTSAASAAAAAGRSFGSGASVNSGGLATPSGVAVELAEDIRPAPRCCRTVCALGDERLSALLLAAAVALSAVSLALQAYAEYEQDAAEPPPAGS